MRLWNPATSQPVGAPLRASARNGGVHAVAVSPDGTLLASGSGDGTVRLWNPASGQPVGAPIQAGAQTDVSVVAFSPDGTLMASDGTVRVGQTSPAHAYAALCAAVGPPTPQDWNHYASGEPQPKVCG